MKKLKVLSSKIAFKRVRRGNTRVSGSHPGDCVELGVLGQLDGEIALLRREKCRSNVQKLKGFAVPRSAR